MNAVIYKRVVRNNVERMVPIDLKELISEVLGETDLTKTPTDAVRGLDRSKWPEYGQALLEMIDEIKGKLMAVEAKLNHLGRIVRVVAPTDNGETGVTRTYAIPLAVKHATVMAISCGSGATPAMVTSAKCDGGVVTVEFDVDPSTDHKVSIWVAAPDKILA